MAPVTAAPFAKIVAVPFAELLARVGIAGEAATLLAGEAEVAEALARLEAAGMGTEAARLMAHALPPREAVWWACMCARHTGATPAGADGAALAAAEEWVRRQTDETRRAAFAEAERAAFGTPEAWAAVAAFWSGDSMSPPGQPKVPPGPHLCGTAVAGSVALAAVRVAPQRREARLRRFLESGRDIAGGGVGRLEPEPADVGGGG